MCALIVQRTLYSRHISVPYMRHKCRWHIVRLSEKGKERGGKLLHIIYCDLVMLQDVYTNELFWTISRNIYVFVGFSADPGHNLETLGVPQDYESQNTLGTTVQYFKQKFLLHWLVLVEPFRKVWLIRKSWYSQTVSLASCQSRDTMLVRECT